MDKEIGVKGLDWVDEDDQNFVRDKLAGYGAALKKKAEKKEGSSSSSSSSSSDDKKK